MTAAVAEHQRAGIRAIARPDRRCSVAWRSPCSWRCVFAAGHGQLDVPPAEVLGSLMHRIGLDIGPMPHHPQGENTLWQVRFPRVVMAALVGACLATAGALMQGVFGNPLAEPGVVGVSAGAAVAAATVIVFELTFAGTWTVAICAFVGGLVTTTLVYVMSRDGGRTEVVTLVLTGIAINAMTSAGLAFLMFLGDTQAREEIVFWTLGSLNGSRWAVRRGRVPDGRRRHRRRDVPRPEARPARARRPRRPPRRRRRRAAADVDDRRGRRADRRGRRVLRDHLLRRADRAAPDPDGRRPGPPAAGARPAPSAAPCCWCWPTCGRAPLVAYADLPIGMLTALVGGPFFFWLIRRARRTAGGWA